MVSREPSTIMAHTVTMKPGSGVSKFMPKMPAIAPENPMITVINVINVSSFRTYAVGSYATLPP
jgi:hypothetical protein